MCSTLMSSRNTTKGWKMHTIGRKAPAKSGKTLKNIAYHIHGREVCPSWCKLPPRQGSSRGRSHVLGQMRRFGGGSGKGLACLLLLALPSCAPTTYRATVYHLGEYHSMTCTTTEHCRDTGLPRLSCQMSKE